ncbi:unnamed protein product [Lampetra planeri]
MQFCRVQRGSTALNFAPLGTRPRWRFRELCSETFVGSAKCLGADTTSDLPALKRTLPGTSTVDMRAGQDSCRMDRGGLQIGLGLVLGKDENPVFLKLLELILLQLLQMLLLQLLLLPKLLCLLLELLVFLELLLPLEMLL